MPSLSSSSSSLEAAPRPAVSHDSVTNEKDRSSSRNLVTSESTLGIKDLAFVRRMATYVARLESLIVGCVSVSVVPI